VDITGGRLWWSGPRFPYLYLNMKCKVCSTRHPAIGGVIKERGGKGVFCCFCFNFHEASLNVRERLDVANALMANRASLKPGDRVKVRFECTNPLTKTVGDFLATKTADGKGAPLMVSLTGPHKVEEWALANGFQRVKWRMGEFEFIG